MRILLGLETLGVCALLAITTSTAKANGTYDFTFTGGGISATGVIDVGLGGLDDGGYIDVTSGPNQGTFAFQPITYYENINGDNDGNDNLVFPGSPSDFLDGNGLGFGNANAGYALWDNGGGTYSLWGYNYPTPPGGGWGSPYVNGSATIGIAAITSVPDGGMTVALLGGALVALQAIRRKLSV